MTRRPGSEERVPLTPAFLVAAASALVGVDLLWMTEPGSRRDAAFVNRVGRGSHVGGLWATQQSRWPVPEFAHAEPLARWAERAGMLVEDPLEGDLFLLWDAAVGQFERVGIVASVVRRRAPLGDGPVNICEVIEGGSSADGQAGGHCARVDRYVRPFLPKDRFVRWADPARLDPAFTWRWVMEKDDDASTTSTGAAA